MYDYLIVGAGIYGAVVANLAKNAGKKVLIVDKRSHIGGNIYSEQVKGINVHKYGAHIFHTNDDEVYDYLSKFCKFIRFINMPIAIYKDEVYNLPFNMNTFNKMFNVITPEQARKKIEEETEIYKGVDPKNLKEQALKLVGETIYKKLIYGYTKKQWGRPLDELPASIINRIPLRFTYDNNYFDAKYQGIPEGGFTVLIENLIKDIEVVLDFDYLEDTQKYKAKKIVYCGKIDEYFEYCFGKLDYRSLRFEEKMLEKENFQGCAVVNYTDEEIPYTRIIEHKHFLKDESSNTIITYEYPDKYEEGKEAYYPINDEKNIKIYNKYKALAESFSDIHFGGRLGTYSYLDMDVVVRRALDFAKEEGLYE